MFITFKCPTGQGENEMEQIAAQGASPMRNRNRLRLGRRPACRSCQTKKLRCTGPVGQCDGCRIRSIFCVFSPVPARPHSEQNSTRCEAEETKVGEYTNPAEIKPPTASPSAEFQNENTQNEYMFDYFYLDMENMVVDFGDLSQNNPEPRTKDIGGAMDSKSEGMGNPVVLQYASGTDEPSPDLKPNLLLLPDGLSQTQVALDPQPAVHEESLADITISKDTISNRLTVDDNRTKSRQTDNVKTSTTNSIDPGMCDCMHNTVRVVQQLDDDEFRLTTLPLGQVLQLQKWVIAQCCKPINCVNCKYHSTIHTVLMVVCDRLAEMFECIHKRIYKANQRITGLDDFDDLSRPSDASDQNTNAVSDTALQSCGQLYCASSGAPASKAHCDYALFSSQIHELYSNEEQVHMIQVLLKLQIRNFGSLLINLRDASIFMGSVARQSRADSINVRLTRAANNIDKALGEALEYFANNQSL